MENNENSVSPNQQGATNLLNNGDTIQDVASNLAESGELLTEVTSIAQEEARTGQKMEMPTQEEIVARASGSLIQASNQLNNLISGRDHKWGGGFEISRKGMNRVLNAILALPTEGLPVTLQGNAEKLAFALGQKIISDRFIIMQHHINEEIKRLRDEQKANAMKAAVATGLSEQSETVVSEEKKGE